jgi:addiction module HigA family antidote
VLNRAQALAGAVRAADPGCGAHIILVSGDIEATGKVDEYGEAKRYFQELRSALTLVNDTASVARFCFVPGNHDCDLDADSDIRQMAAGYLPSREILKVRHATLSHLLHGKAALTPEMALRIEKAFGPDMDHLLRMQLDYDVAKTREHARDISIKRYVPA